MSLCSSDLLAQQETLGTSANLSKTVSVAPAAPSIDRSSANAEVAPKEAPVAGAPSGAANPAPEPNTLMLLGTGTVVLLLLYTRRRVRSLTAETTQA